MSHGCCGLWRAGNIETEDEHADSRIPRVERSMNPNQEGRKGKDGAYRAIGLSVNYFRSRRASDTSNYFTAVTVREKKTKNEWCSGC